MQQLSPPVFISLLVMTDSAVGSYIKMLQVQERNDVRLYNLEKMMIKSLDIGNLY